MKLSREFKDEQQARERERSLQALGYRVWLKHAADGSWHLFWLEHLDEAA